MNLLHSEVRFDIRWWAALQLVWFVLAKPATILCLLTERDLSTHVKTFDLVLVLLMEKWEEPQQTRRLPSFHRAAVRPLESTALSAQGWDCSFTTG